VLPSGQVAEVVSKAGGPADIGIDAKRRRVLVPLFIEDAVLMVPLAP
jgi:hypothetical protein